MCVRTDSVKRLQKAAECLSQACLANEPQPMRTLRAIYDSTLGEEVPEDIKRLLDRLD